MQIFYGIFTIFLVFGQNSYIFSYIRVIFLSHVRLTGKTSIFKTTIYKQ